jgi:glutamate synthase (NADPH/NADH) small chain
MWIFHGYAINCLTWVVPYKRSRWLTLTAPIEPKRVGTFPFPKSDPKDRKENFSEVQQPYTRSEVVAEAQRCILCGTPVCIDACPVQMDVRGMCESISRGDMETAYGRIRDTNCFLGVTARCCPQLRGLCEDACVMRWVGQPISIGMIQRYVADWERFQSRQVDPVNSNETGKHVSIIGAGPAGLAAAELLRRYGHSVTVYEELATPGGTAWYNVPDYHLPKDVLLYEVDRIKGQGVEIKTKIKVGRETTITQLLEDSEAVLVAIGSKDFNELDTPGINLENIHSAYDFLEDIYVQGVQEYLKHPKYDLGNGVLVIGGGDTALDCARTALRLTQGKVTIVYRRTESEMPVDPIMAEEAKEEGVIFRFLAEPKKYNGIGGKVTSATMTTMKLGEPDLTGRRLPEPVEGRGFEIKCNSVFIAVGRGPDSCLKTEEGLELGKRNVIRIDDHYRTSIRGVFAAGDVTTGETLIVKAMGEGRGAAQRIHEYLMNLDDRHVSLYERYYTQRSYEKMLKGETDGGPPPP